MAFTTEDLRTLEVAIASGHRSVKFADKEVTYHSLTQMRLAREQMRKELGLVRKGGGLAGGNRHVMVPDDGLSRNNRKGYRSPRSTSSGSSSTPSSGGDSAQVTTNTQNILTNTNSISTINTTLENKVNLDLGNVSGALNTAQKDAFKTKLSITDSTGNVDLTSYDGDWVLGTAYQYGVFVTEVGQDDVLFLRYAGDQTTDGGRPSQSPDNWFKTPVSAIAQGDLNQTQSELETLFNGNLNGVVRLSGGSLNLLVRRVSYESVNHVTFIRVDNNNDYRLAVQSLGIDSDLIYRGTTHNSIPNFPQGSRNSVGNFWSDNGISHFYRVTGNQGSGVIHTFTPDRATYGFEFKGYVQSEEDAVAQTTDVGDAFNWHNNLRIVTEIDTTIEPVYDYIWQSFSLISTPSQIEEALDGSLGNDNWNDKVALEADRGLEKDAVTKELGIQNAGVTEEMLHQDVVDQLGGTGDTTGLQADIDRNTAAIDTKADINLGNVAVNDIQAQAFRTEVGSASQVDLDAKPDSFTELSDTPSALGPVGEIVSVDATGTALEFTSRAVHRDNSLKGDGVSDSSALGVADLGIEGRHIAQDTITGDKVEDRAISQTKIAINAVSHNEIQDDAVRTDQIQTNTIEHRHMRDNSVGETEIISSSVTLPKLSAGGSAGQILRINNAGNAIEFVGGPSRAQVNSELVAEVLYASVGNADLTNPALNTMQDFELSRNIDGETGKLLHIGLSNLPGGSVGRRYFDYYQPIQKFDGLRVTTATIINIDLIGGTTEIEFLYRVYLNDANGNLSSIGFFKRPDASNGNSVIGMVVEGGSHDVNAMTIELLGVETTVDGLLAPVTLQQLENTPDALGTAGQALVINAAGDGIDYIDLPSGMSGSIVTDSTLDGDGTSSDPLSLADESVNRIKLDTAIRIELDNIPGDLTDLGQVPSSLGDAGQVLKVNSAENALEFADDESGTGGLSSVSTSDPLRGDGTTGDPVTVINGGIRGTHISSTANIAGDSLADNAITEEKIRDNEVTRSKLSASIRTELDNIPSDVPDNFTDLDDTPSALGAAGQVVKVNAAGDALEFANDETGTEGLSSVSTSDPLTGDGTTGDPVTVINGGIRGTHISSTANIAGDSLADNAITEEKIRDNEVARAKLAGSVRTELDNIPDNFIDLGDTPSALGTSGQVVKVNSAGTALEFADDETGVGGIASVSTDATIDGDGTPSDALGLADNAVTTPKILDEAVTLAKLATSIGTQLTSIANKLDTVATDTSLDGDGTATDPLVLADDAVTTSKILNDAVTYDKVSQAIVDQLNLISEKLASVATDASIGGDGTTTDPLSLADDAVTTSKILNDAVTYDKVSQAIVDQLNLISEKLASVATDVSLDGTGVGSDPLSLADNSVSTTKIQDRAVTNLKLAQTIVDDIDSKLDTVLTDSTLDGNGSNIPLSLADDAVSTVKVQDEAITQDKLSPDVVTLLTQSEEGGLMAVASDSSLAGVGTSDSPLGIADDGVTTPKILDLNVTGAKLADDSVSTIKVIDQAITEAKLHPDVVAQLGDNENLLSSVATDASIDGDGTDASPLSLADNAVTTPKILNGAVSRVKLDNLLTEDLDSKLETVSTNTTIDGNGTDANPLALANGSVNRLKLNDALTAEIDGIPDNFTDLDDTPGSLGTNGQILQVNTAEDALEFVDKGLTTVETSAPVSGDGTASDPVTINNGTIRGVHVAANADISGGSLLDGSVVSEKLEDDSITEDKLHSSVTNQLDGIPDNITDLDDVPNSLGDAGQTLKVNSARTALIFADDSEGTDGITSVVSDASLDGDGTASDPLSLADNAVTESKLLNRAVSRAKLDDLLTEDLDSKLENVLTDSTLDGNGSNIPLSVADNSVDRAKLAASVRTELDGIPDSLTDLSDTPSALGNSGQILKMNTAGTALEFTNDETGMEGFTSVSTDSTLDGDGTASNPLGLADDSVSTIKVIDQAITEAKLHPDVVAQLGDNENLLSSVATDASIDGDGTDASPLSLADDAVSTDKIQDEAVTEDKLAQSLIDDLDSKLENVLTNSTLDGNGSNIPLGVADNSVDRAKLDSDIRTELDDIPDSLTDLSDTPSALGNSGQILKMNTAGTALEFTNDETGMEGFTSVSTDSTLDGDGTASNPLGLADDAVSTIKVIDQAITEAKLHPDVVAQLGDNENLLSSVASDSSLDGDGTTGDPLSLADDSVGTDNLQDNAVERDKIVDGAISGPKVSTGAISRVKLDQVLLDDLDSKLETVATDSTIDGNGSNIPLGVSDNSVDRAKLAASVRTELDSIPSDVPDNFTDLDDTPGALGTAGQIMQVNSGATALEFVNQQSGGATAFTGLTDTPSNLGSANQIVQVNDLGNALDYIDNTDTKFDLSDLQNVTEIDDNDEIGVSKVTVPETARNSDRETILGTTEFENASVTAGTTHVVEDVSGTQYIIMSTVNTLPVIQVFEIGVGGTLIDRTSGIAPQFVTGIYAAGDQLGPIYDIGDKYALINVTKETILVLNKTLPNRLTFDTAHPLHNFSIEDVNLSDDYSFGGVLFYKRYLYFRDSLAGAGGSTHTFTAVNVDTGVADTPPRNLDHLISDTMLFGDAASVTSLQVSQDEFFIFLSTNATNTLGIKYLADGTDVPDVKNRYVDAFTHYREQVEISSTLTLALNITVDSGFLYFQFRNADGTRTSFVYDVSEETTIENKKILFNHVRAEIVENASITQLRDVPALGTAGQLLEVNAAEDGMIFRDLPPGFSIEDLQDTTEIDGNDEIAIRKITPPDNPRNSDREEVLSTAAWDSHIDTNRNQSFVWTVIGGVNYIIATRGNLTPRMRVYEVSGTSLIDRTVALAPNETLQDTTDPDNPIDLFTTQDFVGELFELEDGYLLINNSRDISLVLNKELPNRLTFNTSHPMHNVRLTFSDFTVGILLYNGYLYVKGRPGGVIDANYTAFNLTTGLVDNNETPIDYLFQGIPVGAGHTVENGTIIDNRHFVYSYVDSISVINLGIRNFEDASDVSIENNPYADAFNAFGDTSITFTDIVLNNNFLYFTFRSETDAFVYDVSGETRIENLKIPYSDFVGNILPEGSITQLGDVTGPIGDAGAPLLVNSAGDALEFGNDLQLANISSNTSAADTLNEVVTFELDYNLENYRGRNLYIRINIDPNEDIQVLGSLVVRRTWESWTKRVSEVADSRPNNITTLDLTALNTSDYDLFILPAVLRDGTTVPISFFRHPDNALGNTVLALGYHNVDLEFRNVGFWII